MHVPSVVRSLLLLASSSAWLAAQRIQVPNPVQPGVPFQAIVEVGPLGGFLRRPPLFLLRPGSGELIGPTLVPTYAAGDSLPPGRQVTFTFAAPASGAGAAGTFLLLADLGNNLAGGQVVAPLTVGGPSAAPGTHLFPTYLAGDGYGRVAGNAIELSLANSDGSARTIASGRVELFAPGTATPLASQSISGFVVERHSARRVAFDLSSLPEGPYVVRAAWTDPVTGASVAAAHGFQKRSSSLPAVALDFPDGKVLQSGNARLEAGAVGVYFGLGRPAMSYAFVLAFQPGATPFAGSVLPFVADDLVLASLQGSVGGMLANHAGTPRWVAVARGHGTRDLLAVDGIRIGHPNLPRLRNLRVHAALVMFGPAGFGTSQPEDLLFR